MDKIDFEYKINDSAYSECFAMHLLERVYDSSFVYASVQDKPDIWNPSKSHGVEVTTLTNTYYNTLNRYKRVWAEKKMTLEQIAKQQPSLLKGKLGINKHGNIILINITDNKKSITKSQRGIASTVALKTRKLQQYILHDKTDLFIFAPNLHNACSASHISHAVKNVETFCNVKLNMYERSYSNILVFTYNDLIVVPLKETDNFEILTVSKEDRDYCDKFASIAQDKANKNRKNHRIRQEELEM